MKDTTKIIHKLNYVRATSLCKNTDLEYTDISPTLTEVLEK